MSLGKVGAPKGLPLGGKSEAVQFEQGSINRRAHFDSGVSSLTWFADPGACNLTVL